jgi:hypothetical protein
MTTEYLGLKDHWGVNLNNIDGASDFISNSIFNILNKGMAQAISEVME